MDHRSDATGRWRKSTYSGAVECVEVAPARSGVLMRSSRDPDGAVLAHRAPAWRRFVAGVRAGDLDDLATRPGRLTDTDH